MNDAVGSIAELTHDRDVDFIEAGTGPLVVLVHSSMAGARQWSALTRDLSDRFRVRAINLFGYGGTQGWPGRRPPSLDDYAELVASAVPRDASRVSLVGHSFGGAVAMRAAARQLRGRIKDLVLIEPSLFSLLDQCDRPQAFHEIATLAETTRQCILNEIPAAAAERFIDYWCGRGAWDANSVEKKAWFIQSIGLLMNEWNAVLDGTMTLTEWVASLPLHTMIMASTTTVRPAREITELLVRAAPFWTYASIREGGHMAAVTNPDGVNPIIRRFLTS